MSQSLRQPDEVSAEIGATDAAFARGSLAPESHEPAGGAGVDANRTPVVASGAPSASTSPHRSGRKALSAGVVRVFADGRTAKARAYAAIYREIAEGRPLTRETARMVSLLALDILDVMSARSELEELERRPRRTKAVAAEIRRLRRRT